MASATRNEPARVEAAWALRNGVNLRRRIKASLRQLRSHWRKAIDPSWHRTSVKERRVHNQLQQPHRLVAQWPRTTYTRPVLERPQ
jgi:hypothetical protein